MPDLTFTLSDGWVYKSAPRWKTRVSEACVKRWEYEMMSPRVWLLTVFSWNRGEPFVGRLLPRRDLHLYTEWSMKLSTMSCLFRKKINNYWRPHFVSTASIFFISLPDPGEQLTPPNKFEYIPYRTLWTAQSIRDDYRQMLRTDQRAFDTGKNKR